MKCKPMHSEWERFSDVNPLYIYILYIGEALLSPSVTLLRNASVSLSMAPSLAFPLCFQNLYRYNEKGCIDNGKKIKAPWS